MKKLAILLLAMLCLTSAAFAEDASLPDMENLTALCNAMTDTMYGQERTAYATGAEDASPNVAYGLIWRLLYRGVIPCQPEADGSVVLKEAELQTLYGQLFASGAFVLPEEDCCAAITRTADGLRFDLSTASTDCAGMQIMLVEAGETENSQSLLCELYHVEEDYWAMSEDSLPGADWYGTAIIEVQRDEAALLGWKIVSFGQAKDVDTGESVG